MRNPQSTTRRQETGYSLIELLVAMGVLTAVMAATMSGLNDAVKANDAIVHMTGMNGTLRVAMDLMVRDLLQLGSGLPPGRTILIPHGTGSDRVRIPGPPGTDFKTATTDEDIAAVIPGDGKGPKINDVDTDVITFLMADSNFADKKVKDVTESTIVMADSVDIAATGDQVTQGQLMLIKKDQTHTLVQVTKVVTETKTLMFEADDSLDLNQTAAAEGTLKQLTLATPARGSTTTTRAAAADATLVTRIRMISYYIDARDKNHPRLVRRVNAGHPFTFDNDKQGTAVALDIDNLQFTYDLVNGETNPANVAFSAADLAGTGACPPFVDEESGKTITCAPTAVKKINITIMGRSANGADNRSNRVYRATLSSQVSFRGMTFIDKFKGVEDEE
jgi:type II secretory pathway pseudopilin PulG